VERGEKDVPFRPTEPFLHPKKNVKFGKARDWGGEAGDGNASSRASAGCSPAGKINGTRKRIRGEVGGSRRAKGRGGRLAAPLG